MPATILLLVNDLAKFTIHLAAKGNPEEVVSYGSLLNFIKFR